MNMTKGFKTALAVPILLLGFGLIWAGCGGDSGSSSPPLTAITSVTQSETAASLSNQSASFAAGTAMTFSSIGWVGGEAFLPAAQFKAPKSMVLTGGTAITAKLTDKFSRSPAVAAAVAEVKRSVSMRAQQTVTGSGSCYDTGTYSYSGSVDTVTGAFNLAITFVACRETDGELNGTYTMSGTATATAVNMTMALTGFSIKEYEPGSNYGTVLASLAANITFTGSISDNGSSYIFAVTGNGTITASEGSITYNLAFTNYGISNTYTPGTTFDTDSITVNGRVSQGWTVGSATQNGSIAYENFVLGIKTYLNWDQEITVNGVYTIDFTPDACFEGRFSIQTATPIIWNDAQSRTTAGRLVVNSNTTIIFNSDGTVTVQYNGADIPGLVNVPEVSLNGVCLIAAL